MRAQFPEKIEFARVRVGEMATPLGARYGAFRFKLDAKGPRFTVIASEGDESLGVPWEHVSVSTPIRCPTWDEMCKIKDLFWAPDEWVVQFHPPAHEYVNNHRFCLHLWRPTRDELPTPPAYAVGDKQAGELRTQQQFGAARAKMIFVETGVPWEDGDPRGRLR